MDQRFWKNRYRFLYIPIMWSADVIDATFRVSFGQWVTIRARYVESLDNKRDVLELYV